MPRIPGKPAKKMTRRTVEQARALRAKMSAGRGMPENWASDALDCYLEGYSITEISQIMDCATSTVHLAIAREALFRLMEARAIERLDEMNELKGEK